MEGKKISFGFTKFKKAEKPVASEKREYIDCLEGKSIKVVGGEDAKVESPLVIPLKPNTLITPGRLKQIADEIESSVQETPVTLETPTVEKPQENESLDQMAVRELLEEAKKIVKVKTGPELAISVPASQVIDGKKESTLDDYENVPVQDFGLAMLRGMGWTAGAEKSKYKEPQLRPKGLGLGADKVINKPQSKASNDKNEEDLVIVKNAFVKITTGKYSGCYGKVLSLDEDNGRVLVEMAVRKETVSLSEFMMHPVTKSEFDKQSRVINTEKYDEYKRKETAPSSSKQEDLKPSEKLNNPNLSENRTEKHRERSRDRDRHANGHKSKRDKHRKSRSSSNDKEYKKKYSSNESLSSESDKDRRRKHKHNKRRQKSPSSDSSDSIKKSKNKSGEGKREIDKKRKGKKKKRDRDRSPNYKKYRK